MRKYENGVANGCGGSSRSCCGGDAAVPELFLGLAAEMEKTAYHLRLTAEGWDLPPAEKPGLYLPTELLEDAGFSSVTGLDDLVCTIEEGRILLELPDEEDEADLWDALRDELPDTLCARMEDAGLTAREVWDILEKEGWFEC